MASQGVFLNSTDPAPLAGYQNAKPQTDGGVPLTSVSLGVPNTGGTAIKVASYTATASDCGLLLVFESAVAVTLTLPTLPPFAQWTVSVANNGAGIVAVSPGSLTLDGGSGLNLQPTCGVIIATNGTNYFSARGVVGTTIYDGTADPTVGLGVNGDLFIELNDTDEGGGGGTGPEPFMFVQSSPAYVWVIAHDLGTYPAVTVIDSSGNWVIGSVHYDSLNQVTLTFSAAFSGTAVLV